MLVYIYDKKTNEKKRTIKEVYRISSDKESFKIFTVDGVGYEKIKKENIKLVVYGF